MGTCVGAGGALSRACPHLPGLHRRDDTELRRERGSVWGCGGGRHCRQGEQSRQSLEAQKHLACSGRSTWLERLESGVGEEQSRGEG